MSKETNQLYRFGGFQLNATERVLLRDGEPIPLVPKALETLLVLVANHGHLVEKEELLKRIWPDTFVEEGAVAQSIFTLRRTLGDTPDGHAYIETVPRRGYRFVAAVQEGATEPAPQAVPQAVSTMPRPRTRRLALALACVGGLLGLLVLAYLVRGPFQRHKASPAGKIMLAVLPFENLSGDPEQEYFSDGLTEEMITQLGRFNPERLGVIARTSAMQYKSTQKRTDQIGRELGVDYILEGSVRHEANRVRVSAQLIQVRDQTHLWAEDYERNLRDVLSLQRDVAAAVAREIEVRLAPEQGARLASVRPVNPQAYQLYLKGRYFWNKRTDDGYVKAIALFEQAIAEQPDYAPAYSGLADAYDLLATVPNSHLPTSEAWSRARAAALKALEIDDTLAEAHASLASVYMIHDWNWPMAEKEFKRAIELNPGYATAHHWYAYYLASQGRTEEAVREIRLAQQLDPVSLIINSDVVEILYYSRRYDEAIAQARKALELDPNFAWAHWWLGAVYSAKQQHPESITQLETAVRLSGGRPDIMCHLGIAYARAGRREEARKILEQVKTEASTRYDSPLDIAWILAALGARDQAFAWVEEVYPRRPNGFYLLKVSPLADPLRSDPRFQDVIRRIGLSP